MFLNNRKQACFSFLITVILAALISACSTQNDADPAASHQMVPGGDPERGRQAIREYGCQSCHTIPGVRGANATVGPPLIDWAERHFIAGNLPNNTDNLILWIRFPQSVEPGTAMPDMGVEEQAARDIAAYLYTLRR